MTIQKATLCILVRARPAREVLLGLKKTGFGQGKFTGFGGKVEPGELVEAAARRELFEEANIVLPIENLQPVGVLSFIFPNQPAWNQEVYLYRVDTWQGEPIESDEMKPVWFRVEQLPFDRMWDDSRYWLPPILDGQSYTAQFTFRDDNMTVGKIVIPQGNAPPSTSIPSVSNAIQPLLASTLKARSDLINEDPHHKSAIRLFNGFLEGCPELVVNLYADTLVLHHHTESYEAGNSLTSEAQAFYMDRLPWVKTVVVKNRTQKGKVSTGKCGVITYGNNPARKILEHGVWYALDLLLHQDDTFYPDTRALRRWAIDSLAGKRVLNTFAYTGSLGVAALAGGAQLVIHLDKKKTYLNLAKTSYTLNSFPIFHNQFLVSDFFNRIRALKSEGALFDCLFLDPPFFSVTNKGRVDLISQNAQLINKVRPLVADGGLLVSVNNALFVSGKDYMHMLDDLCADGYLSVEKLIPIPPDCAGYPDTRIKELPVDSSPFNHATKIAILRVRRKSIKLSD